MITQFGPQLVSADGIPKNFMQAKRLMIDVYSGNQKTIYCGCRFKFNNARNSPGGKIDETSCGYEKPGAILHWEHIVPASRLGRNLSCWKEGHSECVSTDKTTGVIKAYRGRRCCRKVDATFRLMEGDLYNLTPAVGALNMARRNYSFSNFTGKSTQFGTCDFKIDTTAKLANPPDNQKGFIARTYLLMAKRWHLPLSKSENILYKNWASTYPKTAWEVLRIKRIQAIYKPSRPQVANNP